MSAFIVSRPHIQQLVEAYDTYVMPLDDPTATGQLLWNENITSVKYRYQDGPIEDLPGVIGETYVYAHRRPEALLNSLSLLALCDCYSYQSCEHDGWDTSEAKQLIDTLAAACYEHYAYTVLARPMSLDAVRHSDAYAHAPWEV